MGRWSQRRRTGGGVSLNFITSFAHFGTDFIDLGYLTTVSAAAFNPNSFTVFGTDSPLSVAQNGTDGLRLDFGFDVTAATDINYQGTVPSVLSPQTFP